MSTTTSSIKRIHARGFTLVEAMVTLLVLAFGMLAIAGYQITLSRNSDLAKQRTEATRLAQQKLEDLRAYGTVAVTSGYAAWNSLASASDTPATATNTAYARSWAVGGGIDDWQRSVRVNVAWTDRTGVAQSVTLESVISQSDPANVGALNVPTIENGILRRPKGRDINIPIPATTLGGNNAGKSTAQWGSNWLVFNNDTGNVVYSCNFQPLDSTNLASLCTLLDDYLLVGYVTGDIDNSSSSQNYNGLSRGSNSTIYASLGASFSQNQYVGNMPPPCVFANAVDQNSGAVIAHYIAYSCLVQPSDHDNNPSTPKVWTARVNLTPAPTGNSKVCRYTTGSGGNADHPAIYNQVSESLDSQNYYLLQNGNCPAGTVQHQP